MVLTFESLILISSFNHTLFTHSAKNYYALFIINVPQELFDAGVRLGSESTEVGTNYQWRKSKQGATFEKEEKSYWIQLAVGRNSATNLIFGQKIKEREAVLFVML